ncbi:heme o synthase [Buchnera aphidicola (Chaitoregma tattakana)]|uniref:heme o synthase n=1 Tax=Buchnera aphidicola TaxID=9 RepID=UPI0031B837F2
MKLKNVKYYLQIIKPGIVLGNLIPFSACFLFASKGNINYNLFLVTFIGMFLIISGSCVLNNIIDIKIDNIMLRTKNRVLVRNKISVIKALFFAFFLLFLGFLIILFFSNFFSLLLSFFGFFVYIFLYSMIFKRTTVFSIFIGSISGAMPPIIGYYIVSNKVDLAFFIFFFMFFLWQVPHFFSISIFRAKDYKNAKVPILPSTKSIFFTSIVILFFVILFTCVSESLYLYNFLDKKYCIFSILINFIWVCSIVFGCFYNKNIFFYYVFIISILSNCITSFFIAIDYINFK